MCSASDLSRQTCVFLWHRDGLVIGLEVPVPPGTDELVATGSAAGR